MSIDWADVPVSELVRERQDRAGVLETFGIDDCCRGATTLASACRERGLSLEESDALCAESDEVDWSRESMQSLTDPPRTEPSSNSRRASASLEMLVRCGLAEFESQCSRPCSGAVDSCQRRRSADGQGPAELSTFR